MTTIVFRSTKLGLLNGTDLIGSGTYYAELLTTIPTDVLITQRSQLVLATGGNYARQTLTGLSVVSTSTGAYWTFSNPTWTGLTTDNSASIKSMAVIKQAGGSPASTDRPVVANSLSSAYTANGANFSILIGATGLIEIP